MAQIRPKDHTDVTVEMKAGNVHLLKGGQGEPLLVLHHDVGSFGWQEFCRCLAEDYSVYLPDMPGFGHSERPEWARHTRDLAIHLQLCLDQFDLDRISMVGLGYGGWVAAEMVVMNQRRIRRLALVGPAGLQPPKGYILDQFLLDTPEYVKSGFADPASFETEFDTEVVPDTREQWEQAREMHARINWKPYMFSQQLGYLLQDVTVPTLVVFGDRDKIVPPSCGELYTAALPNACLQILPGAGHFIDLESPEELAALIKAHLEAP